MFWPKVKGKIYNPKFIIWMELDGTRGYIMKVYGESDPIHAESQQDIESMLQYADEEVDVQ